MKKYPTYLNGNLQEIMKWHAYLNDKSGRADRAKLRRCHSPYEILLHSPFYGFRQKFDSFLPNYLNENERVLTLACIAGLLSHVETATELDSKSFANQLYGEKQDKPILSELRFNKLQKTREWEDFYRQLRRCIALLRSVNIISLADDIVHWSCDLYKESNMIKNLSTRLNIYWAIEYYQNLPNK